MSDAARPVCPREEGAWAMRAVGLAGGCEECAVGLVGWREECAVRTACPREEGAWVMRAVRPARPRGAAA